MKIIGHRFLYALLILAHTMPAFSQSGTRNDELQRIKSLYRNTRNDSLKLKAIFKIISLENDYDSASAYLNEAIRISEGSSELPYGFYNNICTLLEDYNMYDQAIDLRRKSAERNHLQKKYKEAVTDRTRAAYLLTMKGLYKESIQELTDLVEYAEKHHVEELKGRIYLIFGFAYRAFDSERALKYFNMCMESCDKDSLNNDLNYALNEIGNIYITRREFDKAEYYLLRSLKIREAIGSHVLLSYSYHDIASLYSESGKYRESIQWFLKSAELTEKSNDLWGLAITYCSIARAYRHCKAYSSAESYVFKALDIARKINMKPVYQTVYLEMYEHYREREDYKQALHFYQQQKYYNDSIFEEDKQQQLKMLEGKFESLQKDKEISEQKEILNRQRQLMYFAIAFILVLLVVGIYVYRQYLHKRRLSNMLAEQNSEIESQRDEIATQRDEIASQRDQVMEQKNQIHGILNAVTSSIRYAQTIQQAILPSLSVLKEAGLEYFLIYKPSEIVSGDFYWTYKYNNNLIVTVADCTGHGVPGAFMSMLGITLLKEIVVKEQITNPAEILTELRKEIIKALNQQKGKNQRDGMDIALCAINMDTLELQFAGANNPVYVVCSPQSAVLSQQSAVHSPQSAVSSPQSSVSSTKSSVDCRLWTADCGLIELKGDKMPIGIYERMTPFTLHTYNLNKGDCIYLFSDGYADQFGGTSGKKFKYKQLKELLVANSTIPMSSDENNNDSQKTNLERVFEEWKGSYKQVDDVTIMGIKIK